MKQTDFAAYLTEFLKIYLPGHRELSENTVFSYRDTFRFMLVYAEEQCKIPSERLKLSDMTADFVFGYINWLETARCNSSATRRQRLAAIHVFINFLKTRKPEHLLEFQKILDIKIKKHDSPNIGYLSPNEIQELLSEPDLTDRFGRRDMVLLALMYDTGARVQEICDLSVNNVRLSKPATITLTGKGDKTRVVPLMNETADVLRKYIKENNLSRSEKQTEPLFQNHIGKKLTRAGIAYILKKHCDSARSADKSFPLVVSPHQLRHSKAMHMLKAGTDLIYIRDFLGHSQIATTEIYAKADTEAKRQVIESASPRLTPNLPDWTKDTSLMAMLADISR